MTAMQLLRKHNLIVKMRYDSDMHAYRFEFRKEGYNYVYNYCLKRDMIDDAIDENALLASLFEAVIKNEKSIWD